MYTFLEMLHNTYKTITFNYVYDAESEKFQIFQLLFKCVVMPWWKLDKNEANLRDIASAVTTSFLVLFYMVFLVTFFVLVREWF